MILLGITSKNLSFNSAIEHESPSPSIFKGAAYFVLLIVVVSTLSALIWGLNKGFDITDEGVYLLGSEPLQERNDYFLSYFNIVDKLFNRFQPNVIMYRSLGLLVNIMATSIFALCLSLYFKKQYKRGCEFFDFRFIFLFVFLGNIFYYTELPMALSYNIVTNAIVLLVASFLFLILCYEHKALEFGWLRFSWFAIGFLSSFEVFIKPPSSVLLLISAVSVLFLFKKTSNPKSLFDRWSICFLAMGIISSLLVYFLAVESTATGKLHFLSSIFIIRESIHNPSSLFLVYREHFIMFLKSLLLHSPIFAASFFLIYMKHHSVHRTFGQRLLFVCLVAGLLSYGLFYGIFRYNHHSWLNPLFDYPSAYLFVYIIFFLITINLALYFDQLQWFNIKQWKFALICIFLFLLPFVTVMGTSARPLVCHALLFSVPWMGMVLILLSKIYEVPKLRIFVWLFIIFFAIKCQLKFVQGFIFHSYRVPKGRLHQTAIIDNGLLPNAKYLKFDSETKTFIEEIFYNLSKEGFKKGDPVLALWDMAGIVYLVGGVSPGSALLYPYEEEMPGNCYKLSKSNIDKSKIFLLVEDEIHPEFLKCIRENHINFTDGYINVAKVVNPYPYDRKKTRGIVNIYAPIRGSDKKF